MVLDSEAVKNITDKPLLRYRYSVDPAETTAALTSANKRWTQLGRKRLIGLAIMGGGTFLLALLATSGFYRAYFLQGALGLPADLGFAILFDAVVPMIFGFLILCSINLRVMLKMQREALKFRTSKDEAVEITISPAGLTMATDVSHYTICWAGISDIILQHGRIEFESGVRLLFIPLRTFNDAADQQSRFTEIRKIWLAARNKPV
jgi:hypothetical protein